MHMIYDIIELCNIIHEVVRREGGEGKGEDRRGKEGRGRGNEGGGKGGSGL